MQGQGQYSPPIGNRITSHLCLLKESVLSFRCCCKQQVVMKRLTLSRTHAEFGFLS